MSEGYPHLENEHPPEVIEQVNKIARLLDTTGGFRYTITQHNLESIIEIEEGNITSEIIAKLQTLAMADSNTIVSIDKGYQAIIVGLAASRLH